MEVLLANPRGFCAGVDRAILIVERALERYGAPVYVRHEIVHNRAVVERLEARGDRSLDEVRELLEDRVLVQLVAALPLAVLERPGALPLEVLEAGARARLAAQHPAVNFIAVHDVKRDAAQAGWCGLTSKSCVVVRVHKTTIWKLPTNFTPCCSVVCLICP